MAQLGDRITIRLGTNVEDVVSFTLYVETDEDDGDEIEAVCVTDVISAEELEVN